jgi:aminoglycoside N3'-acetyltransferase
LTYSKEQLIDQLVAMGIEQGDTVLIRAALRQVGAVDGGAATIMKALQETVGKNGTLVTLGFTSLTPRWKLKESVVFTEKSKSNTGALAKCFLLDKGCQRSKHPVNSFLAIGPKAEKILKNHDASSLSYAPMNALRADNAKMLIFGCVSNSPGFTTVHSVQENLGLTKKSWFNGLAGALYEDNGKVHTYIKKDFGGCSAGFSKFYSNYIESEALVVGRVGQAYALLIGVKTSYDIEFKLIKNNNQYFLCDKPSCFSCRVSWKNNILGIPIFIMDKILKTLRIRALN